VADKLSGRSKQQAAGRSGLSEHTANLGRGQKREEWQPSMQLGSVMHATRLAAGRVQVTQRAVRSATNQPPAAVATYTARHSHQTSACMPRTYNPQTSPCCRCPAAGALHNRCPPCPRLRPRPSSCHRPRPCSCAQGAGAHAASGLRGRHRCAQSQSQASQPPACKCITHAGQHHSNR
jgi:hypothetical protein